MDFDPPLGHSDFSIPDTERLSFLYVLQVFRRKGRGDEHPAPSILSGFCSNAEAVGGATSNRAYAYGPNRPRTALFLLVPSLTATGSFSENDRVLENENAFTSYTLSIDV